MEEAITTRRSILKGRSATGLCGALMLTMLGPVTAGAQQPVASFDQLNTRLKPGDRVWLTDIRGRAHAGRVEAIASESLTFGPDGRRVFGATDVRRVEVRRPDPLKNGTLIGLAVGAATGWMLACVGDPADAECVIGGGIIFGALGAGIGAGVGALRPGKRTVVYEAAGKAASARFSIAPIVQPRRRGVVVTVAF